VSRRLPASMAWRTSPKTRRKWCSRRCSRRAQATAVRTSRPLAEPHLRTRGNSSRGPVSTYQESTPTRNPQRTLSLRSAMRDRRPRGRGGSSRGPPSSPGPDSRGIASGRRDGDSARGEEGSSLGPVVPSIEQEIRPRAVPDSVPGVSHAPSVTAGPRALQEPRMRMMAIRRGRGPRCPRTPAPATGKHGGIQRGEPSRWIGGPRSEHDHEDQPSPGRRPPPPCAGGRVREDVGPRRLAGPDSGRRGETAGAEEARTEAMPESARKGISPEAEGAKKAEGTEVATLARGASGASRRSGEDRRILDVTSG